jgi:hypothetical protein
MPGNLRLRAAQYLYEVADADLLLSHQVEEPEARVVAERLEKRLHVELSFACHALYIRFDECEGKGYICVDVCEVM